jgi:uncharacterized membrane protein
MLLDNISKRGLVFILGGMLYALIEISARGYTHWSMVLTGGLCLTLMYEIEHRTRLNFWVKCLLGAMIITTFEFIVGVVVNLIMHWNVWDYSYLPLNVLGQICVPYFFIWYLVSILGFVICSFIEKRLA